MASAYGLPEYSNHPITGAGNLGNLLQDVSNRVSTGKMAKVPDSIFEGVAKNIEETIQKKEWARRPRTYFILHQINRLDVMEAFIAQGLNDTSLPYKGRRNLPESFSVYESEAFLKWQEVVDSDLLHFEEGRHIYVPNGDIFFDIKKPPLGTGSQG